MKLDFEVKASPFVILRVYPTLTISLVDVSDFAVEALETMVEHPELRSESLGFFPHLYRTYQLAFSSAAVHALVQ